MFIRIHLNIRIKYSYKCLIDQCPTFISCTSHSHIWEKCFQHSGFLTSLWGALQGHSGKNKKQQTTNKCVNNNFSKIIIVLSHLVTLVGRQYLYLGVNLVDVWDATKNGLNFFLSQDRSSNLPLFFQWILEKLETKFKISQVQEYSLTWINSILQYSYIRKCLVQCRKDSWNFFNLIHCRKKPRNISRSGSKSCCLNFVHVQTNLCNNLTLNSWGHLQSVSRALALYIDTCSPLAENIQGFSPQLPGKTTLMINNIC